MRKARTFEPYNGETRGERGERGGREGERGEGERGEKRCDIECIVTDMSPESGD